MPRPTLAWIVGFAFCAAGSAADFEVARATNQVGLDLYRQLAVAKPENNFVISPYSIESALALVYAGADGVTRSEMAAALHLPPDEAAVRSQFAALRTALATISSESAKIANTRRRQGGQAYTIIGGKRVDLDGEPVRGIEWHEANRLFAQKGYPFRDSFLKLMREGYAAPLEPVDFRRDAESSRTAINDWVKETTNGKIQNLVPAKGVNADTRLVLVNALYLKAPWSTPFEKNNTQPEPFHLSDQRAVAVPTMRSVGSLGYAHENGLTVVALDYLGRELSFLILLPDEGKRADAVAAALTPADFARWTKLGNDAPRQRVALHLPRFRVEGTTLPLGEALRQLGIRSAFDEPQGSANFDRIAARQSDDYLKFSEVYHQTFIALDEEGTEAAAATAVGMGYAAGGGPPPKPIEVRVDRPFLFAIQHRASGACLFLGRIADPR